jgi:cytochrome c553
MMPVLWISLVVVLICMSLLSSPNVSKADQSEPGRALFNGTTGAPGKARLGTTVLPARRFPCRNCHGRDGEGGNEGNAPAIVWRTLSGATASRSAYDEAALVKLLRTGMNPDGEMISQLMPRYELDELTLASLTSYLQDLPAFQSAGITANQISIGVLVSAVSGKHAAYATRLQLAIDQCSNGRPLFGRRLVVVPIDASDPESVRRLSSGMAAVAGLANSSDFPLRFFTDLGIPVINPLFPLNGDEDDTIVRTMSPSWRDIYRNLLETARSDGFDVLHLAEASSMAKPTWLSGQ